MGKIKFKDLLNRILFKEVGEKQVDVAQGSEFLKCTLDILANDHTDLEILEFIKDYRECKTISEEEYPEEWAFPEKNYRVGVLVDRSVVVNKKAFVPLICFSDSDFIDVDSVVATDMEGTPLDVGKDLNLIHGPPIFYVNIKDLDEKNSDLKFMVYYNTC